MKREQFLGRVTAALRGADLPEATGPDTAPPIQFDDPIETFVVEAEAVAAEVTIVGSGEAARAITAIIENTGERRYVAWDRLDDFLPGVTASLDQAGYERVDARVAADAAERHLDHARIGAVAVGITGADIGIAASGSVVLQHGPGRPRSASLLVEHHIVVLPADRIVSSLGEAMQRVDLEQTSNVAVITGPSRTGDIESIITLGVHGPRHVHVVVVETAGHMP